MWVEQRDPAMHPSPLAWAFCMLVGLSIPFFRDLEEGLVSRVANRIAKYSYGVYLLHCPVLWLGCFFLGAYHALLQIAVVVLGLLLFPIASYYLIEAPCVAYGRRVTSGGKPL
jgi:peptidoglycan/LPS O-acetylase OafA/YrhL